MGLFDTIGQVGDSIDKVTGGRALRGTLAGKPRELASVVPWSDEMGLTNKTDKTSGRDLTDQYGLTTNGSDSFGSHAAGFLADTVLSPGNLIGAYGSFKAAPTLAKGVVGAGKALTGLDLFDHLRGGVKSLANLGKATDVAGQVADPVADYAKLTKHWPQEQPLGMHTIPDHLRETPSMSLLEPDVNSYRLNKQAIDKRMASGGLGDLYHAHQTNMPLGQHASADFSGVGRFNAAPEAAPMSGSQPITDDMWAKIMGLAGGEEGHLRVAIPGVEKGLANAMDGLGPQYGGGPQKFHDMAAAIQRAHVGNGWSPDEIRQRVTALGNANPHGAALAGELPEGSSFLGAGVEGLAFRTPEGGVVRIGDEPLRTQLGPNSTMMPKAVERPDIPQMLQPVRETKIGPYRVEHLPMVNQMHEAFDRPLRQASAAYKDGTHGLNSAWQAGADQLAESVKKLGHNPWDVTPANAGLTNEGRAIIYDGGAISPAKGREFAARPTFNAPDGSLLQQVMAAGGPEKVRESIRQGLAIGTKGQGINVPNMNEILRERAAIQDFLEANGVSGGNRVSAGRPAPSLMKVLGTLGVTASAAGGASYLFRNGQSNGGSQQP